jgi:hypothetical protein
MKQSLIVPWFFFSVVIFFAQATPFCTVSQYSANAVACSQFFTSNGWTVANGGNGWLFNLDDHHPSNPLSKCHLHHIHGPLSHRLLM